MFAGEEPQELIEVTVVGPMVNISGPIWNGRGRIESGNYVGEFHDVVGDGAGRHFCQRIHNGVFDAYVLFDGAHRGMQLQWRLEP